MENTLIGTIKVIGEVQKFGSGFTKRELVITTESKYPQDIKFDLVKERCDLLNAYNLGDEVEVAFNINGNEYQGKHYVTLQAWKVQHIGPHQDQQSAPEQNNQSQKNRSNMPIDSGNDIPF